MEKLLIECTLELFAAGLVAGIQDLGGAGLSCATSELASAGDGGMHVELDPVPLRDSTLAPEEILMSESQERMMAVVEPADVDAFLAICAKWDVDATVIGEVTDTGRLQIDWHGERVVDVPPRSRGARRSDVPAPVRAARLARTRCRPTAPRRCRGPTTGEELRETLLRLAGSPNLCDKSWITDQYDRYVRGNTVLAQPSDSGMVRVDEETGLGVAVSTDCNGRFATLDPYAGAQLALAEAYRNVATGGADPAGHLRLPQLRLAGGPRRDVAVRRGLPRPQGRLRRARHPGHRRQRQPLQPDRRDGDPADAGGRGARRDRRRHRVVRRPASSPPDETVLPARRDPRGAVRLGVGARRARPPRRAAAGGRPGRARRRWPSCSARRSGWSPPRTTCPTAAWPRRWSSRCSRHGVGVRGRRSRATRSSRCSRESAGRVLVTVPADGRRAADRAGRAARRTGHRARRHRRRRGCRSTDSFDVDAAAAARHLDAHAARRPWLTSSRSPTAG